MRGVLPQGVATIVELNAMPITSPLSRWFSSVPVSTLLVATGSLAIFGCGPKAPPPKPPEPAPTAEAEVEAEAEPEPEPPPKVPEDAFSIGTFNLDWAFDPLADKRPKQAVPHTSPDDAAWEWKRNQIADVLVAEDLDIVVLTELGGERELTDIIATVDAKDGPDYSYAWVPSEDKFSGQQVAILSRFPITNERRTDAYAPMHVVGDVELPGGEMVTVIGMHLKEGRNKGSTKKRLSMAESLKRRAGKEQKKRPVIMAGTVGDPTLPFDDGYSKSPAGVLSGESTKKGSDDCEDSAAEGLAQATTVVDAAAMDRIFVCGLEMRGAEVAGRDKIVRELEDPDDTPWPATPIDAEPHRDVSDHLVLWAEVVKPKKPEPEEGAEGEGEEAAADG